MKAYIWERAFQRTWKSAKWDEYSSGLIAAATFIRLSGGETNGIWHGYAGDLRDIDKDGILLDRKLNPIIYFFEKNAPYYKYVNEPSIIERMVAEKGITPQQYVDWVELEETRKLIEEEYSKSEITYEWKEWQPKNQILFEKISLLAKEFNEANKHLLPFSIRVYYREQEEMLMVTPHNVDINIDRDSVQRELSSGKRKELLDQALEVCDLFGEFLKHKFITEVIQTG